MNQLPACPSLDELRKLAAGELPQPQAEAVASHLEGCDICLQVISAVHSDDPLLHELRVAPGTVTGIEQQRALEFRQQLLSPLTPSPSPLGGEGEGVRGKQEATDLHSQQVLAALPPGSNGFFAGYELLEQIGRGGMGVVYKARHVKLDKTVALKVLTATLLTHPEAVARFEREMRAVGRLSHPNIVMAHDAGESDGTHFLVMEFVEGCDLDQLVRAYGFLGVAESCELVRQAAVGLQHAHDGGLIHRDIKPSNLMLTIAGDVKILDLGLALLGDQASTASNELTYSNQDMGAGQVPTISSELTHTNQVMGTVDYMAPEQGSDAHAIDHRADIYSLGATLYKLLAGQAPLAASRHSLLINKLSALATEEPPRIESLRPELPLEVAELVHRMLAKQPAQRFSSMREVGAVLAPFCAKSDLKALTKLAHLAGAATPTKTRQTTATGSSLRTQVRPSIPTEIMPPDAETRTGVSAPSSRRAKRLLLLATLLVLALAAGAVILTWRTPDGEVTVELGKGVKPDEVRVEFKSDGVLKIADVKSGWTIQVRQGKYEIALTGGGKDRWELDRDSVTVSRGKEARVKVTLKALVANKQLEKQAPGKQPTPGPGKGWRPTPEQQAFFDEVANLPTKSQADAVAKKLQEVNPRFDGKVKHQMKGAVVSKLEFASDFVTEIWPVRALATLEELVCKAQEIGGALQDLSPLEGLKLKYLNVLNTRVADLSPLSDMPLESFEAGFTRVSNLASLREMKTLKAAGFFSTPIADVSPLSDLPIVSLGIGDTKVTDLTPLRGMKTLQMLDMGYTSIKDLSPLKGIPLKHLLAYNTPLSDLSPLAEVESLQHLNITSTRVTDLSPLKGLRLTTVGCGGATVIPDLSALEGRPVSYLVFHSRLFHEPDEKLLRSLPLTSVEDQWGRVDFRPPVSAKEFWKTFDERKKAAEQFAEETAALPATQRVAAVKAKLGEINVKKSWTLVCPVEGDTIFEAKLTTRWADNKSPVCHLTPLRALAGLKKLTIVGSTSALDLSPVNNLPLEELNCQDRGAVLFNAPVLRGMKTLKTINGEPAAQYLESLFPKPKPAASWPATPEQQEFFDAVANRTANAPWSPAQAQRPVVRVDP